MAAENKVKAALGTPITLAVFVVIPDQEDGFPIAIFTTEVAAERFAKRIDGYVYKFELFTRVPKVAEARKSFVAVGS